MSTPSSKIAPNTASTVGNVATKISKMFENADWKKRDNLSIQLARLVEISSRTSRIEDRLATVETELKTVKTELKTVKTELKTVKTELKVVSRRLNQYELIIFARQEASLIGKNGKRLDGRQVIRNKMKYLEKFHEKMHARNLPNARKNELRKIAGDVYASRSAHRQRSTSPGGRGSNDLGSMNTSIVRNAAISTGASKQKRSASNSRGTTSKRPKLGRNEKR